MSEQPLRVLQVIGAMDRGGAETMLMNLYRHIDRSRIQFDFLVHETRTCDYDEEIRSLGGKIFSLPRFWLYNLPSYVAACRKFFSAHTYQVVHGHIGFPAAIYLQFAKKQGAYTIAHSHAQHYPIDPAQLVFWATTFPTRHIAHQFLACSLQAGVDQFGSKAAESQHFHVLNNGIDLTQVRFSPDARRTIREELNIPSSSVVIGHVGRLTRVKNHSFLLQVFNEFIHEHPDTHLLLVGRGELETHLQKRVELLGLQDHVHFLGVRNDVPALLSSMDALVFPSHSEGLAMALIEAQATGLPCLASTGVPELACIQPNMYRLPLNKGAKLWSHELSELLDNPIVDRTSAVHAVREAGFDIASSAEWLTEFYLAGAQRALPRI